MTISDSAFSAYLDCPYKALLTLQQRKGKQGHFQKLQSRLHEKLLPRVESEILRVVSPCTLSRRPHTTLYTLRRGSPLILNTVLSSPPYSCRVVALQRVAGQSSLGGFHYTPILFHEDEALTSHDKLRLAFAANILGRIQGHTPSVGHIVLGTSCSLKKVSLKTLSQETEDVASELLCYSSKTSEPRQLLNSHCHICIYHDRCVTDARRIDHLSQLQRISATEIDRFNSKGIFTVNQLSYTFRPRKRPKRQGEREYIPYHHSLKALAIREQRTHVLQRPPSISTTTRVYVDMEGDRAARNIYLIGLLIVRAGRQRYCSFWSDDRHDEERMFHAFFGRLARLDLESCHMFHYGSYDGRALKRMIHLAPTEGVNDLVTNNTTNVLANIYAQVYFPTYGNGLKELAASLGFKWTYPGYSGKEAILWRHLWDLSHSARIKTLLTKYNRDDCMALRLVHEAIEQVAIGSSGEYVDRLHPASSQQVEGDTTVSPDSRLHTSDYKDWGRREFAREEFRRLADCAYFEYQRNRVYVRTNTNVKRYQCRSKKRTEMAAIRPNKIVDEIVAVCPRCKSDELVLDYQEGKERYVYDLKFTRGGIRRWVTKRRMPRHDCVSCGRVCVPVIPRSHQRLGHNLLAWAMYQHVNNRTSLANLSMTARECFGLDLQEWDFVRLKVVAGKYYQDTYDNLLRQLVPFPVRQLRVPTNCI